MTGTLPNKVHKKSHRPAWASEESETSDATVNKAKAPEAMIEQVASRNSLAVIKPCAARGEWVDGVKAAWRKTLDGIIETGRLLQLGQDSMPRDEFYALVEREFGFSKSMVSKLIAISKDTWIPNVSPGKLPTGWSILYALTKIPAPTRDAMLAEGSINPSMTKIEADSAVWLEKHRKGARLKKSGWKPKPATKKPATKSERPAPLNKKTADDLHDFLTRLVTYMQEAPPNIASTVRTFLLPEERSDVQRLTSEAISWLSEVYDAAGGRRTH